MNVFDLEASVTLNTSDYERQVRQVAEDGRQLARGFRESQQQAANFQRSLNETGNRLSSLGNSLSESNISGRSRGVLSSVSSAVKEIVSKLNSAVKSMISHGLDAIKSMVSSAVDMLKSATATMTKAVTATIATVSAGIAAFTKSALDEYTRYEQLVGGVDTLFAESSQKVQDYAANAYKTAGMSANDYMENVTNFAASLLQGLGGDTEKAADIADIAIKDMSDNANKMGTDIQRIQDAYQGFAKQNYVMLDNLKLGFGGTKGEMARLLNEANKLDNTILGEGVEVDEKFEDVSFDSMIRAIHVIQQEMGITGTTSAEAAKTIEGSVNSMKAAWNNLKTEISKDNGDIDSLINYFVASVETAASNIVPRVEQILGGIGQLVTKVAPIIAEAMPKLVVEILPALLSAAVSLTGALVQGIVMSVPAVLDAFVSLLATVSRTIEGSDIGGGSIITNLSKEIQSRLPGMIHFVKKIIKNVFEKSSTVLPEIVKSMASLTSFLVKSALGSVGLGGVYDYLSDKVSDIIVTIKQLDIGNFLTSYKDTISAAQPIFDTVFGIVDWLIGSAPTLTEILSNVVSILANIFNAIEPFGEPVGQIATATLETINKLLSDLSSTNWSDFNIFGTDEETGKSYWAIGAAEISNNLDRASTKIEEFFSLAGDNSFSKKWFKFWNNIGGTVYDAVNWIDNSLITAGINFGSHYYDFARKCEDFGAKVYDTVENIKNILQEFTDFLGEIINPIGGFIDDTRALFETDWAGEAQALGSKIMGNFAAGIDGNSGEVKKATDSIASIVWRSLHHSTPEEGLLKDDDKWGADFVDNFIGGILSKQQELQEAVMTTAGIATGLEDVSLSGVSAIGGAGVNQVININFPHGVSVSDDYGAKRFADETVRIISERLRDRNIIENRAIGGT